MIFKWNTNTGAKIGFADYLSRHPSSDAKQVSTYDSMFTVAKISHIRSAHGFKKEAFSKGKLESPKANDNNKRVCKISNTKQPVEGKRTCYGNWTNHRAMNCISGRSLKSSENLIGTIIETDLGYKNSRINLQKPTSNLVMERKIRKLLERHPSISSSDETYEINQDMQAVTTEVRSTKSNTIFSIPSICPCESYPPVNPENCVMSIIPINCRVVSKQNALPEFFTLRFIESQYSSDPQLQATTEMIKSMNPHSHTKSAAMSKYYAQYTQEFQLKDGCLLMDERLVIPNTLQAAVNNRLHYYQ